jgi:phosphatidylserine decarboxylase
LYDQFPETMPEPTTTNERATRIPGIDAEANTLLGIGLGLTGLALGLRPRLAPLPLALTALAAALYRDPERHTPAEPYTLFAPADGTVFAVDEVYEHRFVHSDCLRIAIHISPLDVPVNRSPGSGLVRYMATVSGEHRAVTDPKAAEVNERVYLGLETEWGPLLLALIAGPLARRIVCKPQIGDSLLAGERIGTLRFGARTDLYVQRDAINTSVQVGDRVSAGLSRLAMVVPSE